MLLKDGGWLQFGTDVLSMQGDQVVLGIRSRFYPPLSNGITVSFADADKLPVEQYELEPGQTLHIDIPGLGKAELTGELLDHMPLFPFSPAEPLDPAQDQLRIVSPILLRGSKAIMDIGGSASGAAKDAAVYMYEPGVGRLIVSAENFQGAVKGENLDSRITFEINGTRYQLLSGAPITRARDVYVQLDPSYQPSASQPVGLLGWTVLKGLGKEPSPD